MRESLRLFFYVSLALSLLVLWTRWEKWQRAEQQTPPAAEQRIAPAAGDGGGRGGERAEDGGGDLPVPSRSLAESAEESAPAANNEQNEQSGRRIVVDAEWYVAELSEDGGDITSLQLKKHKTEDGENFPLLRDERGNRFLAQSGLTNAKGGGDFPYHNSKFVLQNPRGDDLFANGGDTATVAFRAEGGGVVLEKRYVFRRTSYIVDAILEARNTSGETLRPFAYFQLTHDGKAPASHSAMLPTFFGAAVYTDKDKFVKISFEDIGEDSYPTESDDGWIAFIQRYFAVAWLPEAGQHDFFMRKKDGGGRVGVILPFAPAAPGEAQQVSARLFAGAQEQDILNRLHEEGDAPGIHLAVDYGWLTFIAVLLYKLLAWIHGFVGNWGIAVILLTLTVKLVFYPLSSASYRSMAKMKAEAPRIKKLQERHANDKQKMQQEMMALYRDKKINPLGGCLPILVQIPVFIALYWVLLGSVELRQAPFGLWIQDLSAPDPYFILPVMMGGAMYLQTLMSPAPPDPTQAMIMRGLPIFFAVFSVFFPSGLVVYWLSNTLLSIAQQWHITRSINKKQGAGGG